MKKVYNIKGKKGFQKIDPNKRKDKKITIRFTCKEHAKIEKYCIENNISIAEFIRINIDKYLKD